MSIKLCLRKDEARRHTLAAKRQGKKIGVVPTMGALHRGHLSLVNASSSDCDFTVVTIFVNPTQFGPQEDLASYPRNLDEDLDKLEGLGVDLVFAPSEDEMYPAGQSTRVHPPKVAEPLEGQFRPDHFEGVATVVLKLFHIIPADVAFFGQKDFQQTRVIQQMSVDLDLPICIQVCPIIRAADGLALSSRNAYLSELDRKKSASLPQALKIAAEMFRAGKTDPEPIQAAMLEHLSQAGIEKIDYVVLADPDTLLPVQSVVRGTMVLIAAYCGNTRLIDNVCLG